MTRRSPSKRRRRPKIGPESNRSRSAETRLRIQQPEDFLAVVPYLLGFHPVESLVALFFDKGRVRLTARMDLPPESAGPALVAEIGSLGKRARAGSVVFLVYSEQPAGRVLLEHVVAGTGLEPLEALLVSPERWWSALCPGEAGCCPGEGTPYDLSGHPLCAEAVLAGLSAVGDRTELAALVAGPPAADREALEGLGVAKAVELFGVDQLVRQRRLRVLVEEGIGDPDRLSDADCAEMAALCLDLNVRDIAWALMTRDDADSHLALWRRVLSRSVDDLASAPLGLVGIAAWISGNGALLNCSIDRLAELDPEYGLLSICRDISWRAIHPSLWDTMSADMRTHPALLPALAAG